MNRKYRRKGLFDFAKEKVSYKSKFYKILFWASEDDMPRIIAAVKKNSAMKKRMETILFPKTISDMCGSRIVINNCLNIDYLKKYYMTIFRDYSLHINKYIKLKFQFEKFLFSGDDENALQIIELIEKEMGLSVWTISKKMLLYDKIYGLEKHKRYLSEIQSQTNNNLLGVIFELESYFAEKNTSYSAYKKRLESYSEIFQENDIVKKYMDFRFIIERGYDIEKIRIAYILDSQLSIVDMYETYVLAEQLMLLEKIESDNQLEFDDFRIHNIDAIKNRRNISTKNNEYYELLEKYTCGKYDEFIDECKRYLIKFPQDFQCIILLVKACIFLNRELETDNELYTWIHDIYKLNERESEAIQNLFSYLKTVKYTSWEYKVMGLIARKTTMPQRGKMCFLSVLNDINISPNIVNNILFGDNVMNFLSSFSEVCPVTQRLFLYKLGLEEAFPVEIQDKRRRVFFKIDKLIEENRYEEALEITESIDQNSSYFLERVLRRKIVIYEGKKDYLAETKCVVNAILKNSNLMKRIDLQGILDTVNSHISTEIKSNIYYVVLVYLCKPADYNKQRIAYANYLEYNGFKSLNDIIIHEREPRVLVEFLDKVCVQHILKRDIILNSKGNRADELRVEILKALTEIDEINRKKYFAEITAITKQKSIKDRIKQINQSRVFVDTDNIKKENDFSLREDFNRYLSMKNFDEELITYDIYSDDYINHLKKIVDEMNERIKTNAFYSQKMIILKGIITTVTEEFLFNEKYGLNTFLSSRIRHGYCKKQLTMVFQEYSLLSKKRRNNSTEYLVNEYWDDILPKNGDGSQKIKESLSKFTLAIERKIEEIKTNWLSIKYKEETESVLDFTSCVDKCLLIDMDNIIDFDTFYDELIQMLWSYTLNCLEKLRNKIQNDLLTFFQDELTSLSEEIGAISDTEVSEEVKIICKNINLCRSKIGGTTKEFANVFEKRNVSYMDFSMTELVDTCLEIITKLNNDMTLVKLTRNIKDMALYKGENFPYFVDAVTILINNALEHSGMRDLSELELIINIDKEAEDEELAILRSELDKVKIRWDDADFIRLSVANNLSEDIDLDELQNKIDEIFNKTKDTETAKIYSQKEGGTGLYKLYNTFQYNINSPCLILSSVENCMFTITILFQTLGVVA